MNYTSKINLFLFSLLLLFPASLISGPLIPELIMNIISIFFIIRLIKDKKIKLLHNNFFYYYCFFVIYITLNAFFSLYADEIFPEMANKKENELAQLWLQSSYGGFQAFTTIEAENGSASIEHNY